MNVNPYQIPIFARGKCIIKAKKEENNLIELKIII